MRTLRIAIAGMFLLLPFAIAGELRIQRDADGAHLDVGEGSAPRHIVRFALLQQVPSSATVTVRRGVSSGSFTLDPRSAAKPQALRVAAGEYEVTIEAPHHRPVRRTIRVTNDDLDLGRIDLVRDPVLTGSVKMKDGSPVAGAVIAAPKLLTRSDALGRFELEVSDEWPSQLEVSYPGLATSRIAVPRTERSAELPPATLSKASRITLEIESLEDEADVDLARETGINRMKVLDSRHVRPGSPRTTFDDLAAGDYIIVIRGHGPLQRFAIPIHTPEAEAVTRPVRIDPLALEIEVRRGDAAIPGASVTVQSDGGRWASTMRTDSEGRIREEAWQRGDFLFAVQVSENSPPALIPHPIEGTDQATVRLELPDRAIAGRVIDADSGAAVAGAAVRIESVNDDGTGGTMSAATGSDGAFRLEGLRDGTHTLVVEAENYLPSEPDPIRVDQTMQRRELKVRIAQGVGRRIRLVTAHGAPIARALVISSAGGRVTGVTKTDDAGGATLRIHPGRTVTAFFVPPQGSFAIARLEGKASDREEVVAVPVGNASLEIRTVDAEGKPVPDIYFAMRYDGEVIPPDVAQVLEMRGGLKPGSSRDGIARLEALPAGFLELWPIRTSREFEELLAAGASAPVQVALKEGRNVATLTFIKKRN